MAASRGSPGFASASACSNAAHSARYAASTADTEPRVVVAEEEPDVGVVVDLGTDVVERPAAAPGVLEHPASTHMPTRAATTVAPP
ncbi:MAG: hypothetical protein M0Z30_17365 [Actinomycetota bacterium]|nr:hypothetical protein [Actinomycetota bacterium]